MSEQQDVTQTAYDLLLETLINHRTISGLDFTKNMDRLNSLFNEESFPACAGARIENFRIGMENTVRFAIEADRPGLRTYAYEILDRHREKLGSTLKITYVGPHALTL